MRMNYKRRDFLKKTGVLSAAGFLSGPFLLSGNPSSLHGDLLPFSGSFMIRNATIITMDEDLGDLEEASILVKEGRITGINKNISPAADVEVIDAQGNIVMPGLIDCHWHLWTSLLRSMSGDVQEEGYFSMTERYSGKYTEEDMYIAALYAATEALHSGITTVSDFNHNARSPEFVLASCRALADVGMRAQVLYGPYRNQSDSEPTHFYGIREVSNILKNEGTFKNISLGLGSRGPGYRNLESDWEEARSLGLKITIHAGQKEEGEIKKLANLDLLGRDVNIIHANAITPSAIEAVVRCGTSITMTPWSEMRIGFGFPPVNRLFDAKVNMALGVDSTALTGNADLFSNMKLIQNVANANAKSEFYMKPHDLIKMVTVDAARSLGLEKITGTLTPGKRADMIMLNRNDLSFSSGNRPKHLIVEATQPENVDLVVVEGRILKRNGRLIQTNVEEVITRAETSFHRTTVQ